MDWRIHTPQEGARHWSHAEGHASSSVLIRMLNDGWEITEPIQVKRNWYNRGRYTEIFTFSLRRDGKQIQVPVMANPAVRQIVDQNQLNTQYDTQDETRSI
jgi:hypothetical protein